MEIWLFLHNTTSHKPGLVIPQISLTHRPKDCRVITILVELAFLQAMSYCLSSKTSPPISLLSHSNLVSHFLISRTLLSRHNHCAPPIHHLCSEDSRRMCGWHWEHPKAQLREFLLYLKVSHTFHYGHTQAPPPHLGPYHYPEILHLWHLASKSLTIAFYFPTSLLPYAYRPCPSTSL